MVPDLAVRVLGEPVVLLLFDHVRGFNRQWYQWEVLTSIYCRSMQTRRSASESFSHQKSSLLSLDRRERSSGSLSGSKSVFLAITPSVGLSFTHTSIRHADGPCLQVPLLQGAHSGTALCAALEPQLQARLLIYGLFLAAAAWI